MVHMPLKRAWGPFSLLMLFRLDPSFFSSPKKLLRRVTMALKTLYQTYTSNFAVFLAAKCCLLVVKSHW